MFKIILLLNVLFLALYSNLVRVQITKLNLHLIEHHSHHTHDHSHNGHNKNKHNHDQEIMILDAPILGSNENKFNSFHLSKTPYSLVDKLNIPNNYLYLLHPEILKPPIS